MLVVPRLGATATRTVPAWLASQQHGVFQHTMVTSLPHLRAVSNAAATSVADCLEVVRSKVLSAARARDASVVATSSEPRLVAVSKTKPVEILREAYDAGHRHFGENYVQELVTKAPLLPEDVEWHFIGHLQSNKAKLLVNGCPSLACVETIDSEKLAKTINKAWLAADRGRKLRVMVQVNTSGEGSKNGVQPENCVEICRVIAEQCQGLHLVGFMTIGAPDYSGCRTEDFQILQRCREEAAAAVGREASSLEMSMGMSNDYETAIRQGSSSVRVGSLIFGARQYKV